MVPHIGTQRAELTELRCYGGHLGGFNTLSDQRKLLVQIIFTQLRCWLEPRYSELRYGELRDSYGELCDSLVTLIL